MLNKLKKSNNEGFTIIEVMIVLAIAGLIILVVLLAVPALQRNGRNTAMKNDATSVSGAVGEFRSNNDGQNPNNSAAVNGSTTEFQLTRTGLAGASPAQYKVQTGTTVTAQNAPPAAYTAATGTTIYVVPAAKCLTSNYTNAQSLDVTAGSARSTAVIYPVEQSNGAPQGRCLSS